MFCASEWFRVQGPLGVFLHSLASGAFGLMSVVLPVFLFAVAIRLIRHAGRGSGNPRVIVGLVVLKMLTSGLLKFLCLAAGFILGLYVALKYTEVIEWLKTLF